ncbi:hypothetical protein CAEBREN_08707 [Caenorhabditis brenneri]|uniref:Uncharacterized protein n=1 Tax=Caenorhabditis brenneri TaxID=135651 RepID=G0MAU9_CAEBE|nr:hypothetical protein CAEBREN_08707 [Caenorhabditis brenneri]
MVVPTTLLSVFCSTGEGVKESKSSFGSENFNFDKLYFRCHPPTFNPTIL